MVEAAKNVVIADETEMYVEYFLEGQQETAI